jgi:GNAT superfamily N-acetyltransferase
MASSHLLAPTVKVGPTSLAELEQLEPIIIKPAVMRGCFGTALAPRLAREVLVKEWRACQENPSGAHLVVSCTRHGRQEVAGAGYLLDGELRFFVTPELHRHGLGRALVTALRGEAERRELHELSAWVFPENTASGRLLESCGFAPGATMQVVSFERPVVHYILSLDTGPAHLFGVPEHPGEPAAR